jgi:hypothetical protein
LQRSGALGSEKARQAALNQVFTLTSFPLFPLYFFSLHSPLLVGKTGGVRRASLHRADGRFVPPGSC